MGDVWEALKKHEKEEQARAEGAKGPESGQAKPGKRRAAAPPAGKGTNTYAAPLVVHHDRGGAFTEQYRALRTHLLAQYSNGRLSVMVTSATPGEGKTVTCLNLALALTDQQERTIVVVDCDLRKKVVGKMLRIDNAPGMAEILRDGAKLEEAIRPTTYPNLFVIPAGQAEYEDVGELVGRPELEDLVGELRRRYDHVLFDTPPVNMVSDVGILGRAIGEALLIVRMNKTHRESVDRAIRLLRAANVNVAGLVLTHQKYYIPDYLYRYS